MNKFNEILDVSSYTHDELKTYIEQLEDESLQCSNREQAIKLVINSIYGAFANQYFHFYNLHIAEAITLQGQDAIRYSEACVQKYFKTFWINDKEIHKQLGYDGIVKPLANDVWVYSDTDSFTGDAIINTINGEIRMDELYNTEFKTNGSGDSTIAGHESITSNIQVLNWTAEKNLHYGNVKRLIRHKVSKPKWKIKTKSGKEIIITNDHSMVVFRDNIQITVKPQEILPTDKILCIKNENYYFDEIVQCECIGEFNDEYVYDIEMLDESHTFIANDMLIHNSGYLVFSEAMKSVNWTGSAVDFILKLNEIRLGPYLNKCFEKYAEKYNSENYLNFELETIANNGIWVAKKKYVQNIVWKDGKTYDNLTLIKAKGLEIIQSSTPAFARKKLKDLVSWIFAQDELKSDNLIKQLKEIKSEFKLANIEEISANRSISDYRKFILNDNSEFQINKGCPIHVRAAGYYNYLLNNSKHKGKYQLITSGQKIRYYHTDDTFCDIFAYVAGDFPYEFAPQISYETQFEKFILEPLNRIIVPAGLPRLSRNLVYTCSLF